MNCVNNKCCYINWPCKKPTLAGAGIALLVTAFALSLLTIFVAKRMIGQARIGIAGAVVLSSIALLCAAVGGTLFGLSGLKNAT